MNVNTMFEENLGLLRQCAHNWSKTGMEWDEAYQEGAFGLLHAAEHFDSECGLAFSTYAVKCINGYIAKSRRKQTHGAMLPHYLEEKRVAIRREAMALAENGAEPTAAVIAAKVGLPVDKVEAVLTNMSAMVAMDAVNENGSTLADTIADGKLSVEDQLAHDDLEIIIRNTIYGEARRKATITAASKLAEKTANNVKALSAKADIALAAAEVARAKMTSAEKAMNALLEQPKADKIAKKNAVKAYKEARKEFKRLDEKVPKALDDFDAAEIEAEEAAAMLKKAKSYTAMAYATSTLDVPMALTPKQHDAIMRKVDVVISRYVHSQTLQDVADELGLTRERVRQLEMDGLKALKDSESFRDYLLP